VVEEEQVELEVLLIPLGPQLQAQVLVVFTLVVVAVLLIIRVLLDRVVQAVAVLEELEI
jgi:hypothetical protein